jgi:hypothetical protein
VYSNSIDAFKQLLSPIVSQISAKSGRMQNGITYCIVQVLLANGDEYRLEAYEEEADELYRVAGEQSTLLCMH